MLNKQTVYAERKDCIYDLNNQIFLSDRDLWIDANIISIEKTVTSENSSALDHMYNIKLKINDYRFRDFINLNNELVVLYTIFQDKSEDCKDKVENVEDFLNMNFGINNRYLIKLTYSEDYSKSLKYELNQHIPTDTEGKTLKDENALAKESTIHDIINILSTNNPANQDYAEFLPTNDTSKDQPTMTVPVLLIIGSSIVILLFVFRNKISYQIRRFLKAN